MGKMVTYLAILIFIDLLLITTGQLCATDSGCSFTSIIFNAILDFDNLGFTNFVKQIIGNLTDFFGSTSGLLSLLTGAGVTIGIVFSKSDMLLSLLIAGTLALIGSDFIIISTKLFSLSPILTMFIMGPITILFYIVVLDWVKGKD